MSLSFIVNSALTLAAPPNGYYDNINTSNGATLHSSLHEIIDDHQRFPYNSSGTDTWDILENADQDPNNPSRVLDVYKNASYPKYGGGNNDYNREHTWPKSYGFPDDNSDNYPFTDTHQLFISNSSYNSSRGNKPYDNCSTNCDEKPTDFNNNQGGTSTQSNWTQNDKWETWIGRRGDVARAIMYMAVRYDGGTHGVTGAVEPDLRLTDDLSLIDQSSTGRNLSVAYMGLKSVLLQWHQEDPVDDVERRRNDIVFNHQGNRNPFIDHPEFVLCVFTNDCSGIGGDDGNDDDTTAPQTPEGLSAIGGRQQIQLNWDNNTEADLAGYHVYRKLSSDVSFSRITGTALNQSEFLDTQLSDNLSFDYYVTAVDTSFNESSASVIVTAMTDASTGPVDSGAWINEIHYDNASTDSGEFVEVAGTAGLNLSGWQIVGYNGSNGSAYKTINLAGVIPDQANGFGTLSFEFTGMQNGSPDGLALIDASGNVVLFISYEGSFTASSGPASGLTSQDIGAAETSSTPVGHSLQLAGSGSTYSDFSWSSPDVNTAGAVNTNQAFSGTSEPTQPTASFEFACNGLVCQFDASASSSPAGGIDTYTWSFGDNVNDTGVTTNHTYSAAGDYSVTLDILAADGGTDSVTQTVSVEPNSTGDATLVWINEIHYDNAGSDTGEFVELAGASGTDLTDWTLVTYNGNGGRQYNSVALTGVIANQSNGFGTISFEIAGLQNGSPDGLALVDNTGQVVQFLSYEGSFVASDGIAAGMSSEDIGVRESSSTPVGMSLQLAGTGYRYSDFTWQSPNEHTAGNVNAEQFFIDTAPSASFEFSCETLTCQFDARGSSTQVGEIIEYQWQFGDDTSGQSVESSHQYASGGEYTVTLTVVSSNGKTNSIAQQIIVEQPSWLFENTHPRWVFIWWPVYSQIIVDQPLDNNYAEVSVNISHTYRGDVSLRLYAPDGRYYDLKKQNRRDSDDNIVETYSIQIQGQSEGIWTLRVRDHYFGDHGILNNWSIEFK
ncbi:endonuclease [Pleionea sediminis]|uniref:endonuclease n=1 Tax=Pleionea sediminis TaxID=2569479 RepID=UPI00197B365B|nr:endonuclease [Pleionea sediminis]